MSSGVFLWLRDQKQITTGDTEVHGAKAYRETLEWEVCPPESLRHPPRRGY